MADSQAPKPRRRLVRRALSAIALIVVVALAAAIERARRFPQTTGRIDVAGLAAPIEIVRGPFGVPHVIAKNAEDAYFGLGFCEAQDRTLQLELFRRAASGRVAELIGEGGVPLDRFSRTIGFRRIAEQQIKNASPRARALTVAFVNGINAGLRSLRATPPELALLGGEPGAWEPLDCMAVARLVSWGLAKDHVEAQVLFARIAARAGAEKARALLPISPRAARDDRACAPPRDVGGARELFASGARLIDELGLSAACSNWMIGGGRAASGKPLFAYDSHQTGARIPGEVYLAHLVGGDELDVSGGVIVGSPGYYAGVTRETAFAPTNVAADAADLFALDLDATGRYVVAGAPRAFESRSESIAVKGRKEPIALAVRETVFGPVVSDLPGYAGCEHPIALRWAGARPELRIDGYVVMPMAKNWRQFRDCLSNFEAAAQHFGFAQSDGTIAYQVIGPIARREKAPPPWPAPPETEAAPPLLGLDDLPHLVNPPDGFVVTANQRPIHADEPFYFGRAFVPVARHDRLVELCAAPIAEKRKATVADVEKASLDLESPAARRIAPVLAASLARAASTTNARWVGERLAAWDHRMSAGAVEPLLYHALVAEVSRKLLEPDLGAELAADYAARPDVAQERLASIIEDATSPFWRGFRDVEVGLAAEAALAMLERHLGRDRARWRWDALHTVTLTSYLHDVTTLLDQGPFGVPGDDDTPFRFGQKNLHEPFRTETVALLRLIADLGDPSEIRAVVSSGEQGWPFHPHWRDQLPLWLEGRTIRIPRELAAVRASAEAVLVLAPAAQK